MKQIFIAYNNKDKVLSRLIYHKLVDRRCSEMHVFMDEFSIKPGEDWKEQAIKEGQRANLGIVVLSEYTSRSEYVPQEIGIMLSRRIPMIYVALHEDWRIPPGYEKTIKSFPLYEAKSPEAGLSDLCDLVIDLLRIKVASSASMEKLTFDVQHMKGGNAVSFPQRDAYILVHAMKCAESQISIMGENALHPIHGGFEHLLRLLEHEGSVRILLLDYDSSTFTNREVAEEATDSGRVRADWLASIGNLIELERKRNGHGNLSVRFHSLEPKGSLIVVDDWLVQFNPYEPAGIGGRRGFGHEMRIWLNRGEGVTTFRDYSAMFEHFWKQGRNVDIRTINIRRFLPHHISE